MDFALMKEVLINLCELSAGADDLYKNKIPTWEKIISSIPPYTQNSDGAICEWLDDSLVDNYNHRHVAHLYPLFPGKEVSLDSDPQTLAAFGRALDMRQMKGLCAWSYPHFACIYARLGRSESAMQMLDCLGKSVLTPNFMLPANDWRHMGVSMNYDPAPIQHDAIMGIVETLQEMLIYYKDNTLHILPALPKRIKNVLATDLRVPFGKISISYEQDSSCKITLLPNRDGEVKILYLDRKIFVKMSKNENILLDL
jgi:alpha-L-fucosidase 2